MAGSGAGIGSALVQRAREASQRAKAADALGFTATRTFATGMQNPVSGPMYTPNAVQPVKPAAENPDLNTRMYGIAEAFLSGLSTQLQGGEPATGSGHPPSSITGQFSQPLAPLTPNSIPTPGGTI